MIEPFNHLVIDIIDVESLSQIKSWAIEHGQFSYWNPQLCVHQIWIQPQLFDQFLLLWGSKVRVR